MKSPLDVRGWCWWYRKHAPGDVVLEEFEKAAREAKKGLWVDPAPVPPWVYRKARRGQSLDLSNLAPLSSEAENSGTYRGHHSLVRLSLSPRLTLHYFYPIIGTRRSHGYYRPECPNYIHVAPQDNEKCCAHLNCGQVA